MKRILIVFTFTFLITTSLFSKNIQISTAEDFYGNIAKAIGGNKVDVTSIITNANADPHLFTLSTKDMISIQNAQIAIYNGADYDKWFEKAINASKLKKANVINVAKLTGLQANNNPHIWYNPQTFYTLAKDLKDRLSKLSPEKKSYFDKNFNTFKKEYTKIFLKIKNINKQYKGTIVTSTEPVITYLTESCGLTMANNKFQYNVMNGVDPSPKTRIKFLNSLSSKRVKLLFYNKQVSNNSINQILKTAKDNNIPIIAVTETKPKNISSIEWLYDSLCKIENKLTTK